MARTGTGTAVEHSFGTDTLAAGAAGGFLGSVAFGLLMQFVIPQPVLETAIPAMYGVAGPALAVGWAIHLFHGVAIGLVYALVATIDAASQYVHDVGGGVAAGALYGIVVWLALAVVVMPIWLEAVGFPGAPPLPNVALPSLVGHVVFGAVLGAVYALLVR